MRVESLFLCSKDDPHMDNEFILLSCPYKTEIKMKIKKNAKVFFFIINYMID